MGAARIAAVLFLVEFVSPLLIAQTWQAVPSPVGFVAVDCSGDGRTFLGLTGDSEDLYGTTNAGLNWTLLKTFAGSPISCSSTGSKVATGAEPLVSTNSGLTFAGEGDYGAPLWTANGNLLIARGSMLSISTNDGMTWIASPEVTNATCTATSADGGVIVAANQNFLYVSTNSGKSWSLPLVASNGEWTAVSCVANGSRIIASQAGEPTKIFGSRDFGRTWNSWIPIGLLYQPNGDYFFTSIASSSDGSLLVANAGQIYLSRDFGISWAYDSATSLAPVECSSDGTLIVARIGYTLSIQHIPPPLVLAQSSTQLTLSWPAPSSQYTLQQASDLVSTNWVAVTNAITVTNYRNNVTVAPPVSGNAFYRLLGPGQ